MNSLAFSPDELKLASAGYSRAVSPLSRLTSAILVMPMRKTGKDKARYVTLSADTSEPQSRYLSTVLPVFIFR